MSEITITPVAEASIGPARHPIYCQYQGQSGPQDAFIALDCRDGSAWADYNAEIGNAVPVDVWHGHILRFGISPYASGARINAEMEAMRPRFAEIVAGYSSHWDGSNTRARWTDEAVRAIGIAESETFEYPEDPCNGECAACWPEDES